MRELKSGDVFLNHYSPTGFWSSAVNNDFIKELKSRAARQVAYTTEPVGEHKVPFGIGPRKRIIHLTEGDEVQASQWVAQGYTEAMPRQDTESFVRGLENAFRHFGGVPLLLVLDNLKAGVLKADFYDPELNPKFAAFCKHYEVTALPTRARTPEHKGKVESNIRYVKASAVKGKEFATLAELNVHLRGWERTIADKRIHGTTRKQVEAHFAKAERPSLRPLPPDPDSDHPIGPATSVQTRKCSQQPPPWSATSTLRSCLLPWLTKVPLSTVTSWKLHGTRQAKIGCS